MIHNSPFSVLQELLEEVIEVGLKPVEQSAVEHDCLLAVDDDQVLQRLVVFVDEDEAEGLHDAHLHDTGAHVLDTPAQDGHDVLVKVLVRTLYPLLYDTAVELLVIVVVGAYLARVVAHQKVYVRHDGLCICWKLGDNLAQRALNLLDCLFACFHIK